MMVILDGLLDTMGANPSDPLRHRAKYKHWICDAERMKWPPGRPLHASAAPDPATR